MNKILVVDDELNMRLVLSAMLKKEGFEVATAADGLNALKILKEEECAAVITDLKMPNLDGMGLLSQIVKLYPVTPVIIVTAYGTIATAVDALKKGAFDYITKPFEQEELKNVIQKAVRTRTLNDDDVFLSPEEAERDGIMGSSESIRAVYDTIRQVAPTSTTVIVSGETGTGKELIAGAIHRNSPRHSNPFVKINCAAISEHLMESELFGYEKGAFTGAVVAKPGKFELAHRGTLFLDEVGELPRDMQVKLLRVIQEQEFERVGGLRTIKVDVRLVTATNRNLFQDVKEGRFREDLFYRLNVFPVVIPPLRNRREDVLPLTDFFIRKFNKKLDKAVQGIDALVQERFMSYDWPGNVRELENLIERLVLISKEDRIIFDSIPEDMQAAISSYGPVPTETSHKPIRDIVKDQKEEIEKQVIIRVLAGCGGNVTRAASQMGLSRKGLQLKMIKYQLRK
ncbi:MAG: sigma-54 dependent transcriptional regulator [Syntrophales bacterium LBB04]|nr:sigma-54 dependent transcriptional regulator [Syntrophales bacterium LBB04]